LAASCSIACRDASFSGLHFRGLSLTAAAPPRVVLGDGDVAYFSDRFTDESVATLVDLLDGQDCECEVQIGANSGDDLGSGDDLDVIEYRDVADGYVDQAVLHDWAPGRAVARPIPRIVLSNRDVAYFSDRFTDEGVATLVDLLDGQDCGGEVQIGAKSSDDLGSDEGLDVIEYRDVADGYVDQAILHHWLSRCRAGKQDQKQQHGKHSQDGQPGVSCYWHRTILLKSTFRSLSVAAVLRKDAARGVGAPKHGKAPRAKNFLTGRTSGTGRGPHDVV
jgi:hypothetical protein